MTRSCSSSCSCSSSSSSSSVAVLRSLFTGHQRDRRPIDLRPVCLGKLCYATGADPARRFKTLAELCREQGLTKEAEFYESSLRVLSAAAPR